MMNAPNVNFNPDKRKCVHLATFNRHGSYVRTVEEVGG